MPSALITGVTGQDGGYLAKLLLEKGYRVLGVCQRNRNSSTRSLSELGIRDRIEIIRLDMFSPDEISAALAAHLPEEIYHLAAQSSVAESYRVPVETLQQNLMPLANLLESVRKHFPQTRLYHASSSEMYGKVRCLPVTEETSPNPISPYAVSKMAAHHLVKCYRDTYGLFAVSGILFNHESPLRRDAFFSKKLIQQAIELRNGERSEIVFGNLEVCRDIGFAPSYVVAMWKMLQAIQPKDYIICSGQSVSLRLLVEYVLNRFGLPTTCIRVDQSLFRPNEIANIYGSSELAKQELGWDYTLTPFEVMDLLIQHELNVIGTH